MTTIYTHLHTLNDSPAYCPCCGNSKPIKEGYCLDCYAQSEEITIEAIPNYDVGYVVDVTRWTP